MVRADDHYEQRSSNQPYRETIERRDQVLIGRFSFFQRQAQPSSLDEDR